MKRMKKFVSLLVAMVMVLAMTTSVFAESGTNDSNGKITIDNAVKDEMYSIYQILVLESFDTEKKAYSYKANSAWESWLKTQTTYVKIDTQGYVTWVKDADAAAFAKAALKHVKTVNADDDATNNITSATTPIKATSTTVEFTGLNLGYYLVDSSLGILCSLNTTDKEVVIKEKNGVPTIEKEVKEDSKVTTKEDGTQDDSKAWGEQNTAQINDVVDFKTTVYAKKGAENYVVHDKMSKGLKLLPGTIEIAGLTNGTDYTVTTPTDLATELTDGCDFEIKFTQSYLDTIISDIKIVITYSAIVTKDAEIYDTANTNDTILYYGDKSHTEWDQTKTYTFSFDIVKTDADNELLEGAKFRLYDAKTGGNEIPVVKESDGVYRIATTGETGVEIEAGKVTVKGLDTDTTYWLHETVAPNGYNKLAERVEVKLSGNNNLSTTMTGNTWTDENGGVHITNQKGTELPSTGGMGTTVLYIAGGILVLAAVVLLFARRRAGKEA